MLVSPSVTSNAGFTLIEIMIAVLILSYGMLGIAGLQVAGIKSSHTASTQTIVALETSNLIARMRSNPEYWKKGTSSLDIAIRESGYVEETEVTCEDETETETETETQPEYPGEAEVETDDCINTVASLNDVDDKDCRSEECSSAEIAKYDLKQWGERLETMIPFRDASIRKISGMIAIELSWLEESARQKGRNAHSYQVRVKL